jgi:hypothetical protein
MTQEMTVHAVGDVVNGWTVTIEDGANTDTWTPAAVQIEDAATIAIGDHVAKYGHNVPVKVPVRSEADQAEMDSLTKQRDDATAQLADARKTLADAQAKIEELSAQVPASVMTPVTEPDTMPPPPAPDPVAPAPSLLQRVEADLGMKSG